MPAWFGRELLIIARGCWSCTGESRILASTDHSGFEAFLAAPEYLLQWGNQQFDLYSQNLENREGISNHREAKSAMENPSRLVNTRVELARKERERDGEGLLGQ